jgi:hypothetical protein
MQFLKTTGWRSFCEPYRTPKKAITGLVNGLLITFWDDRGSET